jgi:hypothetical protein
MSFTGEKVMSNAWMLVVVALNGHVDNSFFPNEVDCNTAASIALTGMTPAEAAKAEEAASVARKAWYDSHPERRPRTWAERAIATAAHGGVNFTKAPMPYHGTPEGLIQDDPPREAAKPALIKSARCVPGGQ